MTDELHVDTEGGVSPAESEPTGVFRFESSDSVGIMRWPSYKWQPQPDITAYELALCVPIVAHNWAAGVADLPDEAKRHFAKIGE